MATNPLVSAVIPTHNRAALLPRAVRSVLGQTYPHFECIIVDDSSADSTPEVARQFGDGRVVYVRHAVNRGGSASRNTGIGLARGALLAFLDDDDEWFPAKLEKQVSLMQASPRDVGVVHCTSYVASEDGSWRLVRDAASFTGDVYVRLLQGCCPSITSMVMVRRECFEVCGRFDEALPSYQDYDMWLRLAQSQYRFGCVCEPLVVVYDHEGSRLSVDSAPRRVGMERILRKWGPEIRKNLGEKGYQQLQRCFIAGIEFNATRRSIQRGELRLAARHLLEVICQQPAKPRAYGRLLLQLVRAASVAAVSQVMNARRK
ncbi:MAG: glycosyltransferase family 2 protein [Anaerolineales bacterium]|nr:glycosyltransferase family 2 protein [Anaerolineales bacterium]